MLSAIYNYIHCKIFSKAVTGRKRRIEECNESPPKKYLKMENKSVFSATDSRLDFKNLIESKENCHYGEDDGCCIVAEIKRNWGTSPAMARKSIRKNRCNSETSLQALNSKPNVSKASEVQNSPYKCSTKDVEFVKYVHNSGLKKYGPVLSAPRRLRTSKNCVIPNTCRPSPPLKGTPTSSRANAQLILFSRAIRETTTNGKRAVGEFRPKPVSDRIFKSYRTSAENSSCSDKSKGTSFHNNMKRRLNFLRESYRLAEKYQYSQLLQLLTTRSNTLFTSNLPKPACQKISKMAIPLIDLTKEKSTVTINRSRENLPQTSRSINDDDVIETGSSFGKEVIPKVNSFQEYIKTNPVTEEDVVDQILSRHTKASSEKKKLISMETAKLEVLSESNKKAYENILEERVRAYMRITTPVLVEHDLEYEEKYTLPSLTTEQESQINQALVPSPPSQILAEKFGLQVKRRDMQTLKGLNWLNDEVINFYMNLIMERSKGSKLPNVYAFNTFFYPKLIAGGHASLKRWTKKVDIFSFDMILVPIHLGMHWCMSVIDFRSKEVRYYDSMGSTNNTCLQSLLHYLEEESKDKRKIPYITSDWKKKNVVDIPQQMNGSDCGVFSCMFAEHLARDSPILFTQDNMPYFRRKMVLEILEGRLIT